MRAITVIYNTENSQWRAESHDVSGFTAIGSSLSEVRGLVAEGLPFYLEDERFQLIEQWDGALLSTSLPYAFGHGWQPRGKASALQPLALISARFSAVQAPVLQPAFS